MYDRERTGNTTANQDNLFGHKIHVILYATDKCKAVYGDGDSHQGFMTKKRTNNKNSFT